MCCVQKHGEAGDDECDDCKGGAENGRQVMESERAEDMFSAWRFHLSDMRLHFRFGSKTSYHVEGLW